MNHLAGKMEKFPSKFIEDCLEAHNLYRAIHDCPPLKIDEKLNDYAQEWAEVLAKEDTVYGRPYMPYGENVYVSISKVPEWKIKPKHPVEYWYGEGRYYKYGVPQPGNIKDVSSFTQVIWKETKFMGLGIATNSEGRIYIVCNYEPAGNVAGEFKDNVLPPVEEEMDVPALEETGINFYEPRMDIVRSMERLYAVPSEKLRVWSIWLAKVGEIAEDWQKWLHSHIEVTIKLGNRLREAQNIPAEGEKPTDMSAEGVSEESFSTAQEAWKSTDEIETDKEKLKTSGEVDPGEESADQVRNNDEGVEKNGEETLTAVEGGEVSEAEAAEAIESLTNPEETASPEDATGVGDNPELSTQSEIPREDEADEDEEDQTLMLQLLAAGIAWPIGRPWKPLPQSIQTNKEMEAVQLIRVPSDEEEMLEFVKNFTHQATIYRSYYKHWRETGDQAIKEITGRSVMSTARVQGKYDVGRSEEIDLQAASHPGEDVPTTDAPSTEPGSEIVDTDTDPRHDTEPVETTEEPVTEEPAPEEPSEEPSPESGGPDNPAVDAASEAAPPSADLSPDKKEEAISTNMSKNDDDSGKKRIAEYEGVERSIRDEARADEDIPYFFYLRAEADIEIAIEHNDEEVIPADPDRERIFANYRHLYFNLTDKPGKGGKPWL